MTDPARRGEPVLALRPALLSDASRLLEWRNAPEVRAASRHTEEIDLATHLRWLGKALADPGRKIFIAEQGGAPVGMIRADRMEDGIWELSWLVAPDFRQKGLGKVLLKSLFDIIQAPVRAEIKDWNLASIRMAEAAGMQLRRKEGGISYFEKAGEGNVD